MIHVFYGCGSFGSTVEYVLHNYTNHKNKIDGYIMPNGSMHSFKKGCHISNLTDLADFLGTDRSTDTVTTPTYPFKECQLPEIIQYFSSIPSWNTDKKILIYQPNLEQAELNLLFIYHKLCVNPVKGNGIEMIVGDNKHNLTGWNNEYTHWSQMQSWELREWFSLFYTGVVSEFITAPSYVSESDWLLLTNSELLSNTLDSFNKIINYCNFTAQGNLTEFAEQWRVAQQYVVDEFNLLAQIVDCSINNQSLSWGPINIIAEAIVQQRLRSLGYEIRCNNLNTFPTDSKLLHQLLDKI